MKIVRSVLIFIAGSIVFASCGTKTNEKSDVSMESVIPVRLTEIKKSQRQEYIAASGSFTTDDETMLSFKTGGIITRIYVKEGDKISKGQVLATLDVTEIGAAVNQAQLSVDKASRDYDRVQNLFRDSVATLEQLQNAKTGKEIAEQQLSSARFNLSFSEIRAKADGVVLRKLANAGQIVGPGIPVIQTSSKGESDWLLKVSVSDKEWSSISLKDSVNVIADALRNKNITGYVTAKAENADPMTGSFTIEIKLVDGKKLNIASGMFGKATIVTGQQVSGWQIPYEALMDGNGEMDLCL
ncbi:MAG: efflux RND transporter periplasmic adaptor subunit [Bacteroidetes bacterium]|nr:efflux RND transporter periplasmic adaptor subunit [Bacteroidota bacterium]